MRVLFQHVSMWGRDTTLPSVSLPTDLSARFPVCKFKDLYVLNGTAPLQSQLVHLVLNCRKSYLSPHLEGELPWWCVRTEREALCYAPGCHLPLGVPGGKPGYTCQTSYTLTWRTQPLHEMSQTPSDRNVGKSPTGRADRQMAPERWWMMGERLQGYWSHHGCPWHWQMLAIVKLKDYG